MATVRSPVLASKAYARVTAVSEGHEKYLSFARSFPTLIHTCGLAQATAFALAKPGASRVVLNDLAAVMAISGVDGGEALQQKVRGTPDLVEYQRLTRLALTAASWIKRYAEAVLVDTASPRSTKSEP